MFLGDADLKRFWSYVLVAVPGECWLWTGGTRPNGYGRIKIKRKFWATHCLAYELAHGPIPPGLFVLHSCDVRLCVNPAHLHVGTHQQNMNEMKERDRHDCVYGSVHYAAKLTSAQVIEIRDLYATGLYLQREIAVRFGVTQSVISRLTRFLTRARSQEDLVKTE